MTGVKLTTRFLQVEFENWWRENTYNTPPGPDDVPLLHKLPDGDYINNRTKRDFEAFCGGWQRAEKREERTA